MHGTNVKNKCNFLLKWSWPIPHFVYSKKRFWLLKSMKLGYISHLALRTNVKIYITYYFVNETKQSELACPLPDIRDSKYKDTNKRFRKYIHVYRLFKISLQFLSTWWRLGCWNCTVILILRKCDVHRAVYRSNIPIVKSTRCTNVSNLFILEWQCICFGRPFRPSSAVQDCTYSNRHLSNRYCYLLASGYPLAAVSSICLTNAFCCMYSLVLLMMDGKSVRNMYSVIPK